MKTMISYSKKKRLDDFSVNIYSLFWVLVIGGMIGVVLEELALLGTGKPFQRRSGLIFMQINLIYGIGAVFFTLYFRRIKDIKTILVGAAFLGGTVEYGASLFQEEVMGTLSWHYEVIPGPTTRTDLRMMIMFGVIGVLFMSYVFPLIAETLSFMPKRSGKIITLLLMGLLLFDMLLSGSAVHRLTNRRNGVPAMTRMDVFLDDEFPDALMEELYPNMLMDIPR